MQYRRRPETCGAKKGTRILTDMMKVMNVGEGEIQKRGEGMRTQENRYAESERSPAIYIGRK